MNTEPSRLKASFTDVVNKSIDALTILIVDDESYICELIAELLGEHDHQCDTAFDGMDALEKMSLKKYDVVLTDIKMPRMDGFTLLKNAHQLYPHSAVVVMTAFGQTYSVRQALNMGAEEYLPKPFNSEEVLSAVERAYQRHQERLNNGAGKK
ncbi:response regulator [bacterium]|nr:response regulator [bacterium]MBU1653077.1 response regulator [bacterium]MBU1881642.1 response regulator [bacterium]